jgi:dUTP pyrophosphatase
MEAERLYPEAYMIEKVDGFASYDLVASTHGVIKPGHRQVVPLGITLKLPQGMYGRISARPGLAIKHGLIVMSDIIEPNYTGEIKVVLHNTDMFNQFTFHPGFRIAQLIVEKYESPLINEISISNVFYKVTGV